MAELSKNTITATNSPSVLGILWRLLRWLAEFGWQIAFSVLLGALTIASSVGLIAVSAWMISKAALHPTIADLGVSVVGVRFFGISRAVFRYLERMLSHDTTFRLLARIRVRFYAALEPLAPAAISQFQKGDLLARILGDVETLQNVFLRAVAPGLVAFVIAIFTVVLLAAFDGALALVGLLFIVLTGVLIPVLAKRNSQDHGSQMVATRAALNLALVESIQGLPESLIYGTTNAQDQALEALNRQSSDHEERFSCLDSIQQGLMVLLLNGAALTVLIVAIPRLDGILLATVTLLIMAAFEAFTPLGLVTAHLGADVAAGRRLFEIMDSVPLVTEPANPIPFPKNYDLVFRNVTFRYSAEESPALENFSLTIRSGEHIAILGESGAGKSSLANLLLRFWDVESGHITIGGVELRELSSEQIRAHFGVLSQRATLFNTTILENIRIGRSDATNAEVSDAAQQAQLVPLIDKLTRGYETPVGELGTKLSGGEAQRVALARILLRDVPLYILDEATANLDVMTERALLETVLKVTAGKTLILLTHRRVFLERMDRVIELQGRV